MSLCSAVSVRILPLQVLNFFINTLCMCKKVRVGGEVKTGPSWCITDGLDVTIAWTAGQQTL